MIARHFLKSNANYPSITVDELTQLKIEQPDLVLIDVRTPSEIGQGKIKDALEINVTAPGFKSRIAELSKEKTYLVYCRSGSRSVRACNMMSDAGFEKLYNLRGGYLAWQAKR